MQFGNTVTRHYYSCHFSDEETGSESSGDEARPVAGMWQGG